MVIVLLGYYTTQAQIVCPSDTTISCSIFIDPSFTGTPDGPGFDQFAFRDTAIQTCPDDIIIQRTWVGIIDSLGSDTCIQLITIEVDSIPDFMGADTIRIQDGCLEEFDDMVQESLSLPCNLGIDSVDLDIIEDNCERSILTVDWVFGDQCRDTSIRLTQVLVIENKQVLNLGESTITSDSTGNSGGIELNSLCDPEEDISYEWSNGDVTASLSDVAAGNYTVTITNEAGCEQELSFTIGGAGIDSMQMDTMDMQMDTMDMQMDTMDMQMDTMDMQMDTMDIKMDTMDMQMDTMDMQMDTMDMQMDTMDMQMDTMDMQMDTMDMQMDTMDMQMDTMDMQMDTMDMPMDTMDMQMDTMDMQM
ncbi:MAG: hypothetical protein AAFQ02_07090, partial [Bacteroidota bacterium]